LSADDHVERADLIEVHNGKVHGPLTEQQFIGLRSELGVPTELTVTKTIQPDQ
jgi:hypothetical protein